MKTTRILADVTLLACGQAAVAGIDTFTPTGPSGGSTYDVEFVTGGGFI